MSISAVYYRKADGVIFVFDMTRPRSFTDIVSVWMNAVEAQERYVHVCEVWYMCVRYARNMYMSIHA